MICDNHNGKVQQLLYEFALTLQIIFGLLSFSNFNLPQYFYYVPYYVLLILIIRILYIRVLHIHEFAIIILAVVILILSTYISGSLYLVSSFSFILLSIDVNIERAIRHIKPFYFTVLFGIVGSALLGIINNDVKYMYVSATNTHTFRSSMGFTNPNSFSAGIIQVSMLLLYNDKGKKIPLWRVILALLIAAISYNYSKTKTIIIVCVVLVAAYIIEILFAGNKYTRHFFHALTFSPIICCFVSLFGIIKYDATNHTWQFLNMLLSNRLSYCHAVYNDYGWSIFGQAIVMTEGKHIVYILDNAYAQLGFKFGIIWLVIYMILLYRTMQKAYDDGSYNRVILLSVMSFFGISEASALLIYFNITILFLAETYWLDIEKGLCIKK